MALSKAPILPASRACVCLALVLSGATGAAATRGSSENPAAAFQSVSSAVGSRRHRIGRIFDTRLSVDPASAGTRPSPAVPGTVKYMSLVKFEENKVHGKEQSPATLVPVLEASGDAGSVEVATGGGVEELLDQGLEGVASIVSTGGRAVAKRAVQALPGTWMASGLPKWIHTMKRRLITKEDYLHAHAASGTLYLLGGSLWLLNVMGLEIFTGVPQLETGTAIPLLILGAGLANILTAIPMADTRSWVLTGLCVAVIQLWMAWYVSGSYPASMASADPWLAAASLAVLVIGTVEAEETIANNARARELVRASGGKLRRSGKVTMRRGDEEDEVKINRLGTYANFVFNAPHLYATLVGGNWVHQLAAVYPDTPALLFHAYMALATGSSLALLAPTLYARRLIDAKGLSAMQFLTAAPLVSSFVDAAVMGSAATNNPLEIYLRFLS